MMTLSKYQGKAMLTCTPESYCHIYMLTGLNEEVGELNGKFAKAVRKGLIKTNSEGNFINTKILSDEEFHQLEEDIKAECGDVLWMLSGLCTTFGWSLEDIAEGNLRKLSDRQKRGVIVGSGDHR